MTTACAMFMNKPNFFGPSSDQQHYQHSRAVLPPPPPPVKFEIEKISCQNQYKRPLEYNFNFEAQRQAVGLAVPPKTTVANERSRSLTPKKLDAFKISPNSAFTLVNGSNDHHVNRLRRPVSENSKHEFHLEILAPKCSSSRYERSRSKTMALKEFNGGAGPDRETNLEYAYRNPLPWIAEYTNHPNSPSERIKIRPVSYNNTSFSLQTNVDAAMDDLEKIASFPNRDTSATDKRHLKFNDGKESAENTTRNTDDSISIGPKLKRFSNNTNDSDNNSNNNNNSALVFGYRDTDSENKQNFWHKVFKFEQKKNDTNGDKTVSTNTSRHPVASGGSAAATVEDNVYHRRADQTNRRLIQKHKTISLFPQEKDADDFGLSPVSPTSFLWKTTADKTTPDNFESGGAAVKSSSNATYFGSTTNNSLLLADKITVDVPSKLATTGGDRVTVAATVRKAVDGSNVLDRTMLFENIADQQKKNAEKNNLRFFKKLTNYFASTSSSSSSKSDITLESGKDKNVRKISDGNASKNIDYYPIVDVKKSTGDKRLLTVQLPLPDKNNVGGAQPLNTYSTDHHHHHFVVTLQSSNDKNFGRNFFTAASSNNGGCADDREDSPAHEDRSSMMKIRDKTRLFENKWKMHLMAVGGGGDDDHTLETGSNANAKKRVSFLAATNAADDNGVNKKSERRKCRRSDDQRRKTQPVTQDELEKARSLSQSTYSNPNYRAHRFIQTGTERLDGSKMNLTDYYIPNYQRRDEKAAQKQAQQLRKCKKVTLW